MRSHLLTIDDYDAMCADGTVLEHDERGVKVIQLTDGNILKIFRVKRLISGTNIYSYARRFCRNAQRLHQRGIPTVSIKTLYHFENNTNTAVLYIPLEGKTLRQLIQKNEFSLTLANILGVFLAELHQKGIHFHSLHTGNVVQMPSGKLGLIDISDLSAYAWPLFCNTRVRSFRRLCKYQDDIQKFGQEFLNIFLDRYFNESCLKKSCENKIRQVVNRLKLF
jgi:tRNA A-37 threonylcarbamoyl transferase component Bud32